MRIPAVIILAVPLLALPLASTAIAAPAGDADFASHCAGCHSTQPGKNGVGPSLAGVYGRSSGTAPGYTYSAAMKNANIHWDDQNLNRFLQNPSGVVHGTKMFVSVPDGDTRQHIIAYLQTLKPQATAGK